MTAPCCDAVGHVDERSLLSWRKSRRSYHAIGTIDYVFATLTDYRKRLPAPPRRPDFVVARGNDNLEVLIQAPIRNVYQTLINVDKRPEWLAGVDTVNREMTSERIGMRHNSVFMGMELINTAIHHEFAENRACYSDAVELPDVGCTIQVHYELDRQDEATCLNVNVNWLDAVACPKTSRECCTPRSPIWNC